MVTRPDIFTTSHLILLATKYSAPRRWLVYFPFIGFYNFWRDQEENLRAITRGWAQGLWAGCGRPGDLGRGPTPWDRRREFDDTAFASALSTPVACKVFDLTLKWPFDEGTKQSTWFFVNQKGSGCLYISVGKKSILHLVVSSFLIVFQIKLIKDEYIVDE